MRPDKQVFYRAPLTGPDRTNGMTTMNKTIGLIGPGAMGLGITQSLLRGGFSVRVRDIDPARDALARAAGAVVCASPAEVARGIDIAITVVVDAKQTDDVCFGANGLFATLAPGGIVVVCSTIGPAAMRALAAKVAGRGFTLVDAPISGGPARAAAGTMSMMISGPPAALERCAPAFAAMSDKRYIMGHEAGLGSAMKVVNNMMAAINLVGAAEGLALGIKAGLDPHKVYEVMMGSSGQSFMGGDRMKRVIEGDHTVTAASPILTKDVGLALDLSQELKFPANLGSLAHQALLATVAMGFHEEDDAWVIRVYQALTGIRLPADG